MIGSSPHGQGEETTFAQIVAEEVGVDVDDVEVIHGDHCPHADGVGHLREPHDGPCPGAAVAIATRKIKDKSKALAAHLLEAATEGHRVRGRQVLREGVAPTSTRRYRTSR